VTPPLGQPHFIFPVAGQSEYIDTYGAFRSDVPGNWHHGDDIFAQLGTPVVAVADGAVTLVGWERLGGWRLWVTDQAGDQFYYAHLSGYAPAVMGAADGGTAEVKAGEVLGFIGNTGDAFTTAPHLHFEVHPRQLLSLGYNGAVDPTRYLDTWTHLQHVVAPRPVHPPLPSQPRLNSEARYVWHELLAARRLRTAHAPRPSQPPGDEILPPADGLPPSTQSSPIRSAAGPLLLSPPSSFWSTSMVAVIAGLGTFALVIGSAWLPPRRRAKPATASLVQPEQEAPPPRADRLSEDTEQGPPPVRRRRR
jgi:hypothetical protein